MALGAETQAVASLRPSPGAPAAMDRDRSWPRIVSVPPEGRAGIDLYWLPLGAGGNFVRLNGADLRGDQGAPRPTAGM